MLPAILNAVTLLRAAGAARAAAGAARVAGIGRAAAAGTRSAAGVVLRTERAEDLAEIPLPMHSSAIESATYNTLTGNLEVTFTDGSTASYDVSTNDVIGLVTAESQGAYFNEHIRG